MSAQIESSAMSSSPSATKHRRGIIFFLLCISYSEATDAPLPPRAIPSSIPVNIFRPRPKKFLFCIQWHDSSCFCSCIFSKLDFSIMRLFFKFFPKELWSCWHQITVQGNLPRWLVSFAVPARQWCCVPRRKGRWWLLGSGASLRRIASEAGWYVIRWWTCIYYQVQKLRISWCMKYEIKI